MLHLALHKKLNQLCNFAGCVPSEPIPSFLLRLVGPIAVDFDSVKHPHSTSANVAVLRQCLPCYCSRSSVGSSVTWLLL